MNNACKSKVPAYEGFLAVHIAETKIFFRLRIREENQSTHEKPDRMLFFLFFKKLEGPLPSVNSFTKWMMPVHCTQT